MPVTYLRQILSSFRGNNKKHEVLEWPTTMSSMAIHQCLLGSCVSLSQSLHLHFLISQQIRCVFIQFSCLVPSENPQWVGFWRLLELLFRFYSTLAKGLWRRFPLANVSWWCQQLRSSYFLGDLRMSITLMLSYWFLGSDLMCLNMSFEILTQLEVSHGGTQRSRHSLYPRTEKQCVFNSTWALHIPCFGGKRF